jgi:hypothetical protein
MNVSRGKWAFSSNLSNKAILFLLFRLRANRFIVPLLSSMQPLIIEFVPIKVLEFKEKLFGRFQSRASIVVLFMRAE